MTSERSLHMQAYNERYTGVPFGRCEYLDVFSEGTARERSENATSNQEHRMSRRLRSDQEERARG